MEKEGVKLIGKSVRLGVKTALLKIAIFFIKLDNARLIQKNKKLKKQNAI
ncbi:hypothetical protein P7H75_06160 [Vagococcus carniphilus]|nr:hypothetical protein [Vagococcus carniphilus]MDT2814424.1 hypothetical protein [Vagococcus carniphilus]